MIKIVLFLSIVLITNQAFATKTNLKSTKQSESQYESIDYTKQKHEIINSYSFLNGKYGHPHEITIYDDGKWESTRATDSLKIKMANNGEMYFSINSVHTNGHTCCVNGLAVRVGKYWEYTAKQDGTPCGLRIRYSNEEISFKDVGNNCRNFCTEIRKFTPFLS